MAKFTGYGCLIEGPTGTRKIKLFATLAIFYLQRKLHILMMEPMYELADAIAEQLSELINDFLALKFKLSLQVYQLQNKERAINWSLLALASD